MEKMLIKGVTRDNNIARISIVGVKDQPGIAFKIFSRLAGAQVNVDIILQSIGRDGTKDIAFTVPQSQGEAAMNAIKDMAEIVGCKHVHYHDNVSKVSVVGAGMESNPGVAARMFEALYLSLIHISLEAFYNLCKRPFSRLFSFSLRCSGPKSAAHRYFVRFDKW